MTVTEDGQARLDERVLGAGTNARFALLLLLLVTASGAMLLPILQFLHPGDVIGCDLAAGVDIDHPGTVASATRKVGQTLAYMPCVARYAPPPPWWQVLGGPVVVVMAAAVLMLLLPRWKQRRSRCIRLDSVAGGGEITARVQELAKGRSRVPELFVAPAARTKSAAVFGTNGRPRLCLDGGLVACRTTEPQTFDGVVLHELGHIANRDLTVTYSTVALWRVFLVLIVAPFTLVWSAVVLGNGLSASPTIMAASLRYLVLPAIMALVVYFGRADVLRSRELHADLTAHRWGAPLRHVWAAMSELPERRRAHRVLEALLDNVRTHPRWEARRDALDDPAPLFAVSSLLMFLLGTNASLMNYHLMYYYLSRVAEMSDWIDQGLAAAPAVVVVAVATAVLWRASVRAALLGLAAPTGVRAGLWLGLGVVAGSLASGQSAADLGLPPHWWVLLLVPAATVAFTCWTAQCARLAVASWPGRSLRWPMALCLVSGWLILSAWFVWWDFFGAMYANGFWFDLAGMRQTVTHTFPGTGTVHPDTTGLMAQTLPALLVAAFQALMPAAAVAGWCVPLAIWAGGAIGHGPGWLRRLESGSGVPDPPQAPAAQSLRAPALRQATVPALIGGAVTTFGVAGVQAWLHSLHAAPEQRGGMYALSYAIWSLWAIVIGAAVAAVIAVASPRFRLLTSLIASGVSTLLGLAATVVLISVDGCVQPLGALNSSCAWRPAWRQLQGGQTFSLVVHGALLIAPVIAMAITALGTLGRNALRHVIRQAGTSRPASNPTIVPSHRGGQRIAAALALGAPAAALATVVVLMIGDAPARLATRAQTTTVSAQTTFRQAAGLPVAPVSDNMRWQQVHAWYRLGGRYLLDHATRDYLSMATLLAVAASNGQIDVDTKLMANMRPVCLDAQNMASWEPYYFQVPDPTAQESWHQFAAAWKAGKDCLQAVDHSDANAFLQSMAELWPAERAAVAASNRIKAVIDDPSDSVFKGQATPPPQPHL
ncbi:M48 family metalloprotease [Kitasatospora sp. NPDC056446]|uniref:M48 family metalloprotease n=1 Tax=Kitasatospora sp. NPDC056446 TaxID=3345819 RepID=UPI003676CA30